MKYSEEYNKAILKKVNKSRGHRSSRNFVEFNKTDFEKALKAIHPHFSLLINDFTYGAKELIYAAPIKNTRVVVAVFSTIVKNNSRSCGKDAIRIILLDPKNGKMIASTTRINRVEGWEDRMKERVYNLVEELPKYRCECGGYFVKRVAKLSKSEFYGCSEYPHCTKTKSLNEIKTKTIVKKKVYKAVITATKEELGEMGITTFEPNQEVVVERLLDNLKLVQIKESVETNKFNIIGRKYVHLINQQLEIEFDN